MTNRRRWGVVLLGIGALVGAVLVARAAQDSPPEPVAIIDARLGAGDRVVAVIDRCASEPMVLATSLDAERIIVAISAGPGSGDGCQDLVDVAVVTEDILELEDATSGEVFTLRVVPPERPNRPPGTRQ